MKQFLKPSFKKVKILVAFLIIVTTANAQEIFTISGKVVDKQEGIPGAAILVKGTNTGTSTDFNGNFSLSLNKGDYTFIVSAASVLKEVNVKLNQNTTLTIDLSDSFVKLDEVLVSAVRVKTTSPVTHSNVSKEDLEKRNLGQDIPYLINQMPSVISSSDAGAGIGYTYLRVRGSDDTRINVTVNGFPMNNPESHGAFFINLGDLASSTENIQVQRGVGTSTNGSGAFGASLNLLTDAVSEKAYGEISSAIGSYNTYKNTVKFSTGLLNNHFEIAGRLSKIDSDGYVDRAFTDLKTYYLQGTYKDDNTLIKAITFGSKEYTYQAWYGLDKNQLEEDRRQNPYTYDNETDNYWQDHYQLHWNEVYNSDWSSNLAFNYTRGKGYFEQYKDEENAEDFNNLITDGSDVIVRRWLDNHFYAMNASLSYKSNPLDMIFGVSWNKYLGDHFGEVIWGSDLASVTNIRDRYYFSDASKQETSIFAKTTYKFNEKFTGFVDLQGRFINYETEGLTSKRKSLNIDESFDFFNPKLGLTYELNSNNNLYASFAIANREPNRDDFENGIDTHETLNDYELGWRYKSESIRINSNIYYMRYKNQLVLTGALDDVGAPIRATSGNSYRLGLEVDADIYLTKHINIKPNIAFSSNKNIDFVAEIDGNLKDLGNTDLSFSPDVILGNTITYQPLSNLQFSLLTKYVSKQYMSNLNSEISNSDVLNSYFVNDFNIVYTITPKSIFKEIKLTGLINNVFDEEYVDRGYYGYGPGYDYSGYFPQATRNFLVGATLKF